MTTIRRAIEAAKHLSDEPCFCWDFGTGDEWPHFKDADGRCTPVSRHAQER